MQQEDCIYTTDYKSAYKDPDAIFIGVGTPEQPDGSANLSYIATVCRQIAENVEKRLSCRGKINCSGWDE